MQNRINTLEGFHDESSHIADRAEQLLQGIFLTAGVSMFMYISWLAVKAIYI